MYHAQAVKPLKKGDLVGLFSPAEPLTEERKIRMQDSMEILDSNYEVLWGRNAWKQAYYQAGTKEERLEDIFELIGNESVKALLATWGGKNGNQLIDDLPYDLFRKRRIPVIGFSDTCVLLNPISVFSDIVTFYGPNVAGKLIESDHPCMESLRVGLYPPFGKTAVDNWNTIIEGKAEGVLYGGNLSTFTVGLLGSECLNRMNDIVFFWESASDPPQIMDQYLTALGNAGFFNKVNAMIVGKTLYNEIERKNRPLVDLLDEVGRRYNIPVVQISTFGHCKTENPMIPIGACVSLNTYTKTVNLMHMVVE